VALSDPEMPRTAVWHIQSSNQALKSSSTVLPKLRNKFLLSFIDANFNRAGVIGASSSKSSADGSGEPQSKSNKKTKMIHLECEAPIDLKRNYGMVSTELKKDTRSIEQTLNDIQQKKRLKTQQQTENI